MSDFPISPLFTPPLAFDAPRAERTLADLKAQGFVSDAATTALLNGVFGNAPYLARLALREPETLAATLTQGAEAVGSTPAQFADLVRRTNAPRGAK